MGTFTVLGATGRMGGATARRLLAHGHRARAVTRNPDSGEARALAALGCEIFRADATSAESLAAAFAGADGVFNVQAAFDARGRYHRDEEIRQGEIVAEAVRRAGIAHVVYGSAGFGTPTSVAHFDAKLAIEALLRAACPKLTVLRPAPFMELMTDPSFVPSFSTWGVEPKVFGWDTPKPWIAVEDVGEMAARAFSRPDELGGREHVLVGDVLSLRQARMLHQTITGVRPRGFPLPVWLFRRMMGDELVQMWTLMRERSDDPKLTPAFLRSVHPGALSVEQWLQNAHDAQSSRRLRAGQNAPSTEQVAAAYAGLLRVHLALRRGLEAIERGPGERDLVGWSAFVDAFAQFLLTHHEGEDRYIFPFLRELAASHPDDANLKGMADFLDGKETEHRSVHALCERLRQAAHSLACGGSPDGVVAVARELGPVLLPHLAEEEAILNHERLGRVVSAGQLDEIAEKMVANERRTGGSRALMYFVHSLTAEEQRAHFGDLPWFVRKVLVGTIWARTHRSVIASAHNPHCAL